MARTIDEFKERFNTGVARSNRYEVLVTPPPAMGMNVAFMKDLSISCEAVELPGILLATQEDKQFGPIRKVPYLNVFNDLSMVFICAPDLSERYFFDAWQQLILERADIQVANPGAPVVRPPLLPQPRAPLELQFKLEFYDNYVSTVLITALNEKNESVKFVTCFECYPIEVITQPFSYNSVDDYLKMEVRMAYRYWL
jgi:hypothetical protein